LSVGGKYGTGSLAANKASKFGGKNAVMIHSSNANKFYKQMLQSSSRSRGYIDVSWSWYSLCVCYRFTHAVYLVPSNGSFALHTRLHIIELECVNTLRTLTTEVKEEYAVNNYAKIDILNYQVSRESNFLNQNRYKSPLLSTDIS